MVDQRADWEIDYAMRLAFAAGYLRYTTAEGAEKTRLWLRRGLSKLSRDAYYAQPQSHRSCFSSAATVGARYMPIWTVLGVTQPALRRAR